jgi:hypothetical protein
MLVAVAIALSQRETARAAKAGAWIAELNRRQIPYALARSTGSDFVDRLKVIPDSLCRQIVKVAIMDDEDAEDFSKMPKCPMPMTVVVDRHVWGTYFVDFRDRFAATYLE